MCIEVWKLHLSSCKIKALMTGGKQQQIVTLMDRHFSKEIVYSNGCFLIGVLWWHFYSGDVRIHPFFCSFLLNQQTCAFLRLSAHCGHICVTPAAVWSLTSVGKCERQNISLSTHKTTLSQWDYSMCMSAVCLYVLMAFFVKSNLEIVKGLRHSLKRFKKRSLTIWLLFLGIWVILFNSEMLYSTSPMICRSCFLCCDIRLS